MSTEKGAVQSVPPKKKTTKSYKIVAQLVVTADGRVEGQVQDVEVGAAVAAGGVERVASLAWKKQTYDD